MLYTFYLIIKFFTFFTIFFCLFVILIVIVILDCVNFDCESLTLHEEEEQCFFKNSITSFSQNLLIGCCYHFLPIFFSLIRFRKKNQGFLMCCFLNVFSLYKKFCEDEEKEFDFSVELKTLQ